MLKHKCILCIEPDGEICLLLGMMLHRPDLEVKHAVKIEKMADLLNGEQPALVVIENSFVESTIRSHISAIKKQNPSVKILMISSIGGAVARTASSAGVDLFLTRPFSKDALMDAVLSLID
jgi:DNA-binding NtrC family response regulator